MTLDLPDLAVVGNPIAWFVVVLLALAVFAPRLLPLVGRMLGRMVGMEVQRRVGLRVRPAGRPPRPTVTEAPRDAPAAEATPTAPPTPSKLNPAPDTMDPESHISSKSPWLSLVVVAGAVAVLLWYLLHAR